MFYMKLISPSFPFDFATKFLTPNFEKTAYRDIWYSLRFNIRFRIVRSLVTIAMKFHNIPYNAYDANVRIFCSIVTRPVYVDIRRNQLTNWDEDRSKAWAKTFSRVNSPFNSIPAVELFGVSGTAVEASHRAHLAS